MPPRWDGHVSDVDPEIAFDIDAIGAASNAAIAGQAIVAFWRSIEELPEDLREYVTEAYVQSVFNVPALPSEEDEE